MTLKPMLAEAAPRGRSTFDRQLADVDFPTHILLSEGAARRGGDLFALYNEMEEKDGHLFSVLQTRKTGVLARERKLLPASETDADRRVADFVDDILDCIPQFPQALFNILDALGKGFSVQEIVWTYRDDGRVGVAGLKSRWPGRFCFDRDERLRLLDSPTSAQWLAALGGFDSGRLEAASRPLPERKFLVFTFGGQYGNSYGKGLCARAYWYYWFKKNNLKFWGLYNEKFGAPTVVAKYQHGVTEEERRRLMEVLESLQSDAGVAIPENITLEFLEARNSDGGATYQALGDWCNDEMAKIVLGQTLTSGEGRRSGSLALGQVHADVRREYIESDARDLMAVINGQLIPWIVAFNFPAGTPSPRWIIDPADEPLCEVLRLTREER
ncbi:MAG: DUF935 family protein, partial [Candidatus Sumerlaeota bacterium]|nr:DUF935 family protein [Candidatus Sumerlaeota bacterium]